MLQHRNPVQDENDGVATLKPAPDAENAGPGKSFAAGGKTPGLGRRKALGNITNTDRKPGDNAQALKSRRALGDITNATPVQPSQSKPKSVEAKLHNPALPQTHARQVSPSSQSSVLLQKPCRNIFYV
jgi:hypothetical protein